MLKAGGVMGLRYAEEEGKTKLKLQLKLKIYRTGRAITQASGFEARFCQMCAS